MPITINIYYKGDKDAAKNFAKEMFSTGIVSEIRKKEGNLKYEYFFPMEDENTVLLIDKWENQRALDEHHASQIMIKITELRKKYDLTMEVERFEDNHTKIPRSDEKFIIRKK